MLIRFGVSNYRSMLDLAELSMIAVDQERVEARRADLLGESILAVAAIFGPNASGKSNVIAAFMWVKEAIQNSLRVWDNEVPIEPFAFGDGPMRPSEFVVDSAIGGVRFEYDVILDRERVHYEGLFHYPEKKRRRIFEREGGELKLQRGLGSISGTRELLTDSTLALSAARRFDEPLVTDFVRDLLRAQAVGPSFRRRRSGLSYRSQTLRWFEDIAAPEQGETLDVGEISSTDRAQALALLKLADLGIVDVLIDEEASPRRVRLLHSAAEEQMPLDFLSESEGTRTWYQLIGPVLYALRAGSLLLFDELDASLHPTLSAQLIRLFHDPATNPHGAQLIFTSHDTSLLNHLNRDEVWLTEKSATGATRLGALSDFAGERVRRSQKLESAYLHGRFGALPEVDRTDFLRTLGLIG